MSDDQAAAPKPPKKVKVEPSDEEWRKQQFIEMMGLGWKMKNISRCLQIPVSTLEQWSGQAWYAEAYKAERTKQIRAFTAKMDHMGHLALTRLKHLMLKAKDESVQLKAIQMVLDRVDPIQHRVNVTSAETFDVAASYSLMSREDKMKLLDRAVKKLQEANAIPVLPARAEVEELPAGDVDEARPDLPDEPEPEEPGDV